MTTAREWAGIQVKRPAFGDEFSHESQRPYDTLHAYVDDKGGLVIDLMHRAPMAYILLHVTPEQARDFGLWLLDTFGEQP